MNTTTKNKQRNHFLLKKKNLTMGIFSPGFSKCLHKVTNISVAKNPFRVESKEDFMIVIKQASTKQLQHQRNKEHQKSKKKKKNWAENKNQIKEINKSIKPNKVNQKPNGKERTFETPTTIEPIGRLKKNTSTRFK